MNAKRLSVEAIDSRDGAGSLPFCADAREAARHMGMSESTIRRHLRGLSGWVVLAVVMPHGVAQRPRCVMAV